jgi:hypothetical protein
MLSCDIINNLARLLLTYKLVVYNLVSITINNYYNSVKILDQ